MIAEKASTSVASVSRAFSGTRLPRWELTYGILETLNVKPAAIEREWPPIWRTTREARLHPQSDPHGLKHATDVRLFEYRILSPRL